MIHSAADVKVIKPDAIERKFSMAMIPTPVLQINASSLISIHLSVKGFMPDPRKGSRSKDKTERWPVKIAAMTCTPGRKGYVSLPLRKASSLGASLIK